MLSEPHPLSLFSLSLFSPSSQTATGFAWMGGGTQNAPMDSIDSPAWPGPPKNAGGNPTTNNFLADQVWPSASCVFVPERVS
ncbi:hypothetical protein MCOR26_005498 [Pyricularia oryzae]|uniref:Secreted protein n=1 Tax=Pyricularia grisea TaxID=148305 RepID=A0ABQ8NCQ7_PYRGI|nr:hypothetical protein MCOR26_005498 [Pyricularia oryzae]KAI6294940.1 hypothetical protein MCOR33_008053 [Pyricularia grisea]